MTKGDAVGRPTEEMNPTTMRVIGCVHGHDLPHPTHDRKTHEVGVCNGTRPAYLSEIIMAIPSARFVEDIPELARRFGARSYVVVPVAGPIEGDS